MLVSDVTDLTSSAYLKSRFRTILSKDDCGVLLTYVLLRVALISFFERILNVKSFVSDDTVYFCVCDFFSSSTSVDFYLCNMMSEKNNGRGFERLNCIMNEFLKRVSPT